MNLGIVIGVEKYESDSFDNLTACKNDAEAINSVLENVKTFEEIVYINENEQAAEIKKKLADFVEKYKGKEIKELIFYFSGHGERYEDDFFYLPSDFDRKKRESTGLRNSEVDEWIKTLSPELCVKIVDACFSGTQYIKSESSTEINLKKSAQRYGLNDIYFWFSSRENEASYAGNEYSKFTESILTALLGKYGDVRYREVMDIVADDFSNNGSSKPIFITQSNNIEKFGHVTDITHKLIHKAFGLEWETEEGHSESVKTKPSESKLEQENIFDLISKKSQEVCFSEERLLLFVDKLNKEISNWDSEIRKFYTVDIDNSLDSLYVPNKEKIGEWLEKNGDKGFFRTTNF